MIFLFFLEDFYVIANENTVQYFLDLWKVPYGTILQQILLQILSLQYLLSMCFIYNTRIYGEIERQQKILCAIRIYNPVHKSGFVM